jgi:hypothetical protein
MSHSRRGDLLGVVTLCRSSHDYFQCSQTILGVSKPEAGVVAKLRSVG